MLRANEAFPEGCFCCGSYEIECVTEQRIYGKKYSKYVNQKYWRCKDCGAYVSCHKNTSKPKGILANKEMRDYRSQVHFLFDPIWKYYENDLNIPRFEARNRAYQWLADKMGIQKQYCHTAMFDIEMCKEAINHLNKLYEDFPRLKYALNKYRERY